MKNLFIYSIAIMAVIPLTAMNEKSLWVTTTDNQLRSVDSHVVAASNLLTVLHKKHQDSRTNPLAIPVSAESFDCFKIFHTIKAKILCNTLSSNNYYQLMDTADKLKALPLYVTLLCKVLPKDITRRYIPENITTIYRNNIIEKNHTKIELITKKRHNRRTPDFAMSNDGHHFLHDISFKYGSFLRLCTTKKAQEINSFYSQYNLTESLFSNDGTYLIIRGHPHIYVHHIATNIQHSLILPSYIDDVHNINISPDSKHITMSGILGNDTINKRCALWSFDENNIPQPISLNGYEWEFFTSSAIFHPNNKHIICNHNSNTLKICSIGSPNTIENEKASSKELYLVNNLKLSCDNRYVIACNVFKPHDKYIDILFSVDTLNPVIDIPKQSFFSPCQRLPRLYIPHHELLTHIYDEGHTLQLRDTHACVIGSHTPKNDTLVCALAADTTGNYLASGYSDGTIIIWNLSNRDKRISGTKVFMPHAPIRSLTFSDDQLLLCQSGAELYGDCSEETVPQLGSAIVWDVDGNEVLNCGKTVASIMSKKGNRIITVSEQLKPTNERLGWFDSFVTLNVWNLHQKKTKKTVDDFVKKLTQAESMILCSNYECKQQEKQRSRNKEYADNIKKQNN